MPKMKMVKPANIEEYIAGFPENVQLILNKIRTIIKEIAPASVESFSYGMPAYKIFGRPLVYFAGFKNHIGFYATPTGNIKFTEELSKYKTGKGSIQFQIKEAIPFELIARIVAFRVEENLKKLSKLSKTK
jgi:uncharacterized protein YdhG (YjbR/CyaY superfamily)